MGLKFTGGVKAPAGKLTLSPFDKAEFPDGPPPPFAAEAVEFDGVADRMLNTSFDAGAANSKQLLVSIWVYLDNVNQSHTFMSDSTGPTDTFQIAYNSQGRFTINTYTDGVVAFLLQTVNGDSNAGEWNHVLASLDTGLTEADAWIYLNDVKITAGFKDLRNADALITWGDMTTIEVGNGGNSTYQNDDYAEFYVANEYLDLEIEANRRKFITAEGIPADLGTDGSTPTGTSPMIYLSGDKDVWNAGTNAGTGSDIPMTGSVTDSNNEPVELT